MRKLLVLLVAALACAPTSVGAHASLVGSDPADGAVLETAPATVSLEFSEPVSRSDVAVTAPDGSSVPLEVSARDRTVSATLEPADQRGTYTVAYRVISVDGHPVSGERTFDVTTGRTVDQATTATTEDEGFVARHANHLWWALAAAVVAVGLIVAPLVRRSPR